MVKNDYLFFGHCFQLGLAKGPLLEIGSMAIERQGGNICQEARKLAISPTFGVDIAPGPGVDHVADFSVPTDSFRWEFDKFATAVVFNVLEHTFDPITILRNVIRCVQPHGTILLVVPTVWPLHDFPKDYCRLMPHWFEEFATRHGLTVVPEAFCWLSAFGIVPIGELREGEQYELPSFLNLGQSQPFQYWRSRAVHRIFNTFGRSHWFAHCAIGAALRIPDAK